MRRGPESTRLADRGFTFKDLLAIVACVSVLGVLEFAAVGNSVGKTRLATCIANFEQLSLAWSLYAVDNNAKLVGNPDGFAASQTASKSAWAGGTLDTTSDATNTEFLVSHRSPAGKFGGLLGVYVKRDYTIFRCPEDQSYVTISGRRIPRVRSVSMNGYMDGEPESSGLNSWTSTAFKTFRKTSDIISLKPSNALVFIDESEYTIDDEVWSMDLSYCIDRTGNLTPASFLFIDLPGSRHDRGGVLSFADAHVEHWKWQDQRSMPIYWPAKPVSRPPGANNPDIGRLAQSMSTR